MFLRESPEGFGESCHDVAFEPFRIQDILQRH